MFQKRLKVVYGLAGSSSAAQPLWSAAIYRSFTSDTGMASLLFPR
jgi:hypothetical protein